MESNPIEPSSSKKRPRAVLAQDFAGSFSDKTSFYMYIKEQL